MVFIYSSSTGFLMHFRGQLTALAFFGMAYYASTSSFENKLKNVNNQRFFKVLLINSQQFLVGLTAVDLYTHQKREYLNYLNAADKMGGGELSFQSQFLAITICLIHHVTALIANSFILPDWIEFSLAMTVLNLILANYMFVS
jgi:hypothetical protein